MKHYRAISLLLSALLLSATACGTEQPNIQTDDSILSESTETFAETERSAIKDSLPPKDYGGKDFTILCRTELKYEFDIPEQIGEIVSDAIYERNSKVEERFNIKLKYNIIDGAWSSQNTFLNTLNSSILAGDGEYDMVAGYQAYMITPAMEGYFLNILDMDEIDTNAPWWSKKCNDSITVNNRLYMTTGDIAISLWENIYVMFFNKQLAEDNKLPDLYEIVKNGQWTVDKLYELSSTVSRDINGDTKFDDQDLYGFACSKVNHTRMWQVACNLPITTPDKDGFMVLSFNTERTQNALEKLVNLYKLQSSYSNFEALGEPGQLKEPTMFIENRAMFVTAFLGAASTLRDMNTDFGIIPYPKLDENQDEYRTTAHNSTSMICFPKTVRDPQMSAIIAEALCAESYRHVIPKYYEISLKTKISRDESSEEMIDLIRDSLIFDFGWVHSVPMDSIGSFLASLIVSGSTDFASSYKSKEAAFNAGLEKINKAYGKE
jgi:ABC-type glycerol-3-phosphate transport system substrate-binding protein